MKTGTSSSIYSFLSFATHCFHASRFFMRMTPCGIEAETVAAGVWLFGGCVAESQPRIVKYQISQLHRNQGARYLRNDVHTIIHLYIYIDSTGAVRTRTRWGSLKFTPIIYISSIRWLHTAGNLRIDTHVHMYILITT